MGRTRMVEDQGQEMVVVGDQGREMVAVVEDQDHPPQEGETEINNKVADSRKGRHQHLRGEDPTAEVRALLNLREEDPVQEERLMLVCQPVMRSNKSRLTLLVLKHAVIVVKYFLLR